MTVVIPTYERPHFLREALDSVLGQTRPVDEIIVIDDCSGPTAWGEAQRAAAASERIRLYRQETHQGAAAARNRGLELATGDCIVFLDDDDLLEPRMIERSLRPLESDPNLDVIVCGSAVRQLIDSGPVFRPARCSRRTWEQDPRMAILRRSSPINSFLARREAIGDLRFPEDLEYGEDRYFWLMVARRGRRFTLRPEPDAVVRRHATNITQPRGAALLGGRLAFEKLIADGMTGGPDEYVLIHLRLSYREWATGSRAWRGHFARACTHPFLVVRELMAYAARATADPVGFVWHYFLT